MAEPPAAQALLDAYNDVFDVVGGARLISSGPHTHYVEDRLRTLLRAPPDSPLDLGLFRALPQADLLKILFRAVAGEFVSGPSSLRPATCRLEADPVSGTIEVTRDGDGHEAVLTVIAVVLLCVLAVTMYRRERPRP